MEDDRRKQSKAIKRLVGMILALSATPLVAGPPGCAIQANDEPADVSGGSSGSAGNGGTSSGGSTRGGSAGTNGGHAGNSAGSSGRTGADGGQAGDPGAGGGNAGLGGTPSQGGQAGESGTGGDAGHGGGEDDCEFSGSSDSVCTVSTKEFCIFRELGCPTTFERVEKAKATCNERVVRSSYTECENDLTMFSWVVVGLDWPEQLWGPWDDYELQFSSSTKELLWGSADEFYSTDHYYVSAGSWRQPSGCRSCRICTPADMMEGVAGSPGNPGEDDPSEDCVFDAKGRISLPPVEE